MIVRIHNNEWQVFKNGKPVFDTFLKPEEVRVRFPEFVDVCNRSVAARALRESTFEHEGGNVTVEWNV